MINDVELAGTRAPLVKSLDRHEPLQSMGQRGWLCNPAIREKNCPAISPIVEALMGH
jgi:hypothetical protein